MVGSDDVLACFVAGNVFTWDDWFRLETEDDSLQPTIDMLLNVSVFMWYGAVCPWHKFVANDIIPIYRLVPLGIMVLLFRRLPMVLMYHHFRLIHQIEEIRHALFVGFFGPIGVSAIFYLYISREFLREIKVDGHEREDAYRLGEAIEIVVWFLVICSIVVHGLSVPLGKLGLYLPRTLSTAISAERISASQSMARSQSSEEPQLPDPSGDLPRGFHRRLTTSERGPPPMASPSPINWVPKSFVRAGSHVWNDIKRPHGKTVHGNEDGMRNLPKQKTGNSDSSTNSPNDNSNGGGAHPEISGPTNARPIGHAITEPHTHIILESDVDARRAGEGRGLGSGLQSAAGSDGGGATTPTAVGRPIRSIQFADEASARSRQESPVDGRSVNE